MREATKAADMRKGAHCALCIMAQFY
jgi:hypothetical protein